MFVVFEEFRSGGATSVHRATCPNYARRDAESSLGRWFGPFSTYDDARTLAQQLASFAGTPSQAGVDCCSASPAAAHAPAFQAPIDTGQVRLKRVCLTVMIISLSISALAGIFVLVVGRQLGDFEGKVLGSTTVIGAYSLVGLCGAIWYDRRRYLPLAGLTIAAAGGGMLYALAFIWDVVRVSRDMERILGIQITWTVFLAHTSLNLLSLSAQRVVLSIVTGTSACAALVAMMFTYVILEEPRGDEWARVIGSLSILTVLGTIVAPLARKMITLRKE